LNRISKFNNKLKSKTLIIRFAKKLNLNLNNKLINLNITPKTLL